MNNLNCFVLHHLHISLRWNGFTPCPIGTPAVWLWSVEALLPMSQKEDISFFSKAPRLQISSAKGDHLFVPQNGHSTYIGKKRCNNRTLCCTTANGRVSRSRHRPSAKHNHNLASLVKNSTLLVQVPTPSSDTSTTSPSFSQSCGVRPMPTPEGLSLLSASFCRYNRRDGGFCYGRTYVPVKITSPGRRVVPWLKKAMVFLTLKIMSDVLLSCTT